MSWAGNWAGGWAEAGWARPGQGWAGAGALLAGLLEAARGGWCSEHCVLSVKVPKSLVSRSVWKPDMDFDRLKCIT